MTESVGYREIAEMNGSTVESIRVLKSNDPNFPKPTGTKGRSLEFDRGEIVQYFKSRGLGYSGVGRPTNGGDPRVAPSAAELTRIRKQLTSKGLTQLEFAREAGMTRAKVESRLSGRTKWTLADLKKTAEILGESVTLRKLIEECTRV